MQWTAKPVTSCADTSSSLSFCVSGLARTNNASCTTPSFCRPFSLKTDTLPWSQCTADLRYRNYNYEARSIDPDTFPFYVSTACRQTSRHYLIKGMATCAPRQPTTRLRRHTHSPVLTCLLSLHIEQKMRGDKNQDVSAGQPVVV